MPRFDDEDDEEGRLWEDDEEDDEEEEDDDEEDAELQSLVDEAEEYIETGQARKAVKMWRRSLDRYADEPQALYHASEACLALLRELIGDEEILPDDSDHLPLWEEAINHIEEAISMESDNATFWCLVGELQLIRDNARAAIEAWDKSLAIDPEQDEVRELVEDLRESLGE